MTGWWAGRWVAVIWGLRWGLGCCDIGAMLGAGVLKPGQGGLGARAL